MVLSTAVACFLVNIEMCIKLIAIKCCVRIINHVFFSCFACMVKVCVGVMDHVRICSTKVFQPALIFVLTKNRLASFFIVILALRRDSYGSLCSANCPSVFFLAI